MANVAKHSLRKECATVIFSRLSFHLLLRLSSFFLQLLFFNHGRDQGSCDQRGWQDLPEARRQAQHALHRCVSLRFLLVLPFMCLLTQHVPPISPRESQSYFGSTFLAGKLTNGTVFDSSVKRGQPFSFTIGVGQVIKGWDEGVIKMSLGEKVS